MIIFGSRAAHVKSAQSTSATCPSCGTRGSLIFSVFSRHAHIFWIPIFPIGKKGASQCQHCKHVMEVSEMPDELRREYQMLKSEARTPLWQFAGLVLIMILIVAGTYSSKADAKKELEYISSPASGDVYKFKTETSNYSTMKVTHVEGDSVYVNLNDYETSKMRGVYKIDKEENYSTEIYGISSEDLKEMYNSGEIYDINRR